MKWTNAQGKTINTDDIKDIQYLKNILNVIERKYHIEKVEEECDVVDYDNGFFYKD